MNYRLGNKRFEFVLYLYSWWKGKLPEARHLTSASGRETRVEGSCGPTSDKLIQRDSYSPREGRCSAASAVTKPIALRYLL